MKFGEQLDSSKIKEYEWFYIEYNGLKSLLKTASGPPIEEPPAEPAAEGSKKPKRAKIQSRQWTEGDEDRFLRQLDEELEKVYNKTRVKTTEIQRSIQVEDRAVNRLVARMMERGPAEQGPGEEEFMEREDSLSDIIADVHDLAKFVQVNYTGFYKIIKKHDVRAHQAPPSNPDLLTDKRYRK